MKHTPTPWVAWKDTYIYRIGHMFNRPDGEVACDIVASTTTPEVSTQAENAAHIIKCVNAHDELVTIAEFVVDHLPAIIRQYCPMGVPMSVSDAHNKAREVLNKLNH
jgi:hypothetical protein